jgi:hypothetical protein
VTAKQERAGAMAAIGMGWGETEKYLVLNVSIACDNSPKYLGPSFLSPRFNPRSRNIINFSLYLRQKMSFMIPYFFADF